MKHRIIQEGLCYRLRPITVIDAEKVVELRTLDQNIYVHPISTDPVEQVEWIKSYEHREGDYYFAIENRLTSEVEGLIGIYNMEKGQGEWGRWVIRPGSLAAVESVELLYRIAFERLSLTKLYCRTIINNTNVVSFHDSIGELRGDILRGYCEINGKLYDAVEHYSNKEHFQLHIQHSLNEKAFKIFTRMLKRLLGRFEFHHVGAAVRDIQKELTNFRILGYKCESQLFEDPLQGIKGLFIISNGQPRIELLANMENHHTLDQYIEKGTKFYHFAYLVLDFDMAMAVFKNMRAKVISEPKISVYFKERISFIMLPNMLLIELIETK